MTILTIFIPKLTELLWEIHLDPASQTTKWFLLKTKYLRNLYKKKSLLSKYTIIKHAQARAHTHVHTRIYLSISVFN